MVKDGIVLGKRYAVLSKIGAGGMADVYKGRDQMLNRYVAIKVLKKQYKEDENFVRKFRSEAQAAAGLIHPNIVNVYDVGEDRGLNYMVMELVEGITLKEYIERKGKLNKKIVIFYFRMAYSFKMFKIICKTVKKELAVNQYIDDNTLKEMNHFYFSQCIASLERTVIEKDQTNKNRILSDPYFMKVLQVEKEEQRIHKIDYWLLKRKWIDLYYGLHKRYAKLKKYK